MILQHSAASLDTFHRDAVSLRHAGLETASDNAQRLGGSQSLTTPVVSVATPSLLAPFSGMQTAYNTEYQLTSADLTALQTFTPPGLNMAACQQQQQQQQQQQPALNQQQQTQQMSLASLSNLVMWGAEKQNAEMVNCISNFAANLSCHSQVTVAQRLQVLRHVEDARAFSGTTQKE
ncbi:unnamed protein product [Pleuronectes platessa]|uniref:Uncharacterized protein n=1 Tax=Pleuronectes platessa TaxID=8262 RepID=A0A9N7YVG7_PLEPL|nr:unnamed protein product [Pleuronectes platessa]